MAKKRIIKAEQIIGKIIKFIGTPLSILLHTLLFCFCFLLTPVFGFEKIMLSLTTIVSLEAIYLSLFIQMTVNNHHEKLEDLEEDVDDILEDTEELTK